MIEKTWLAPALSIGVNFRDFWELTPRELLLILDGYNQHEKRKLEYDNLLAFIQGRYFVDALACVVGNMFSKKGAKKLEYPKEPYDLDNSNKPKDYEDMTQEEKDAQAKSIMDNLFRMQENFERAKVGGGT